MSKYRGVCTTELRGGVDRSLGSAEDPVTLYDVVRWGRPGRRRRESVEVVSRGGCVMGCWVVKRKLTDKMRFDDGIFWGSDVSHRRHIFTITVLHFLSYLLPTL